VCDRLIRLGRALALASVESVESRANDARTARPTRESAAVPVHSLSTRQTDIGRPSTTPVDVSRTAPQEVSSIPVAQIVQRWGPKPGSNPYVDVVVIQD
jgi:hypothetical protein